MSGADHQTPLHVLIPPTFNFWKARCLIEPNNNHKPITTNQNPEFLVLFCYHIAGDILGAQISFFSFSIYQKENLTPETHVMMGVFFCVKWTVQKIKHMNRLEIAQNKIWTPRKFPAIRYSNPGAVPPCCVTFM